MWSTDSHLGLTHVPRPLSTMERAAHDRRVDPCMPIVHATLTSFDARCHTNLTSNTTNDTSPNDSTPIERTINVGCLDIRTELPAVATVSSYASIGTSNETQRSYFSDRGRSVIDVAAPGSSIQSTIVAGNGLKSGTSVASPHRCKSRGTHEVTASHPVSGEPAEEAECARPTTGPARPSSRAVRVEPCASRLARNNSYACEGMVDAFGALP